MPDFKFETLGEPSVKLEYESEQSIESYFKSHLLKDAIVELIHSADLSMWVKREDSELQPNDFWVSILKAVAESCRNEWAMDDDISDKDILHQLLDNMNE